MLEILIFFIAGCFLALLFINIYFRVRVLKEYKVLVQNRVQFGARHIFDRKKLEEEIIPKYPQQEESIRNFIRHMRYSIKMATVFAVLITILGAILMYTRS
jgi:hypothetical protein